MQNAVDFRAIGLRLRERRQALKLSQGELAIRAGISASFVGHLERAEKIPSVETVVSLCAALDMSMDDLVRGKKYPRCDRIRCPLYEDIETLLDGYRS